ncbi:GNAT family N-acetyltransferase [Roseomonas gilardii]|uniref:GNAT family N-acetyltransferase n=1 Tax=Roseomonas gilardii TaxID=257708 RepID=UPI0024A61D8C|nr:GNAT family N-acetyltransferase [Roseomonas gilardii]
MVRVARDGGAALLPAVERDAARAFRAVGMAVLAEAEPAPPAAWEEAVAAGHAWVAVDPEGEILGFAVAGVVGGRAHLREISVRTGAARRGIGRSLMRCFLDWAKGSGFQEASLTTFLHLPFNAPFYRRLGFREMPERVMGEELRTLRRSEARLDRLGKRVAMVLRLA